MKERHLDLVGLAAPVSNVTATVSYLQGTLRMQDILYIAIGLLFFVLAIAYVFACDKLRGTTSDE
ncbi:MAG: hypothetical protein P4L46_00940 [Fimbriimonas sp.]|nr:hypothetical protein [Fimbriimonas sp.]